jgi:proteasome assembly chaperone (PAC2) family protein
LLGETVGYPIIPDPKSAEAVLNALSKAIKIKIDTSKLEKRIREMEDFMRKIQEVQRKAIERLVKPPKPKKEELTYIG